MFIFQAFKSGAKKDSVVNASQINVDNAAGYKSVKEKLGKVLSWMESVKELNAKLKVLDDYSARANVNTRSKPPYSYALYEIIKNELLPSIKKSLLVDAKSLSPLLSLSKYTDSEFAVAKAYLDDAVISALDKGMKLDNKAADATYSKLKDLGQFLEKLIRKSEKEEIVLRNKEGKDPKQGKGSAPDATDVNLSNAATYKTLKGKLGEVLSWMKSVIELNTNLSLSEDLYRKAKANLLADAKSLSLLLNSSNYKDLNFAVAKKYLEVVVITTLEEGNKLTNDAIELVQPKLNALYNDTFLTQVVSNAERAEENLLNQAIAKERQAEFFEKIKKTRANLRKIPRKTGLKIPAAKAKEPREEEIKAFATRIPGLINGLKDGNKKNNLNQRIETLAAYRYSKGIKAKEITMENAIANVYYVMAKASDIGLAPQMKTDEAMAAFLDLMVSNAYKYSSKKYFQ